MADDGLTLHGKITSTVTHNACCGTPVEYYVVTLDDGSEHLRPVQEAFRAKDGALEFRR